MMTKKMMTPKLKSLPFKKKGSLDGGKPPRSPGTPLLSPVEDDDDEVTEATEVPPETPVEAPSEAEIPPKTPASNGSHQSALSAAVASFAAKRKSPSSTTPVASNTKPLVQHFSEKKEVIAPPPPPPPAPYPISPVVSTVSTNIDAALERLNASNRDSEDNDSIMGMSTEGDLDQQIEVGNEEEEEEDDDEFINIGDIGDDGFVDIGDIGGDASEGPGTKTKNSKDAVGSSLRFGASMLANSVMTAGEDDGNVSDDDYYKQDYYMLARQVSGQIGDCMSDFSVSEQHIVMSERAEEDNMDMAILKEENERRMSSQEVQALTHPDTPEIGRKHDGQQHGEEGGDYADFYVDATSPLELATPAKKDYKSHFESLLQVEEAPEKNEGEDSGMPVLPQDEEFQEQMNGDAGEGGGATAQDPPKDDEKPGHVRTASMEKWSPFPTSSPKSSPSGEPKISTDNEIGNNINDPAKSQSDFAAAIRRAGSAGKNGAQSELVTTDEPENAFAASLKKAGTHLRHTDTEDAKNASSRSSSSSPAVAGGKAPNTPDVQRELEGVQQLRLGGQESFDSGSAGALTPGASPGASPSNVAKIVRENAKLRKRRKDLLALLSSTAQQFSAYEKVCCRKISELEERNRKLEKKVGQPGQADDAINVARSASLSPIRDTNGTKSQYGDDIVRRLSSGVLMQEKQLKSKDELISQLKLRCEVLKQNLADKDDEIAGDKKMWEEERGKLLQKLDSDSPQKQSHGELLATNMKITRLKKELESALGDITMLTSALERNNETLDATVMELDKLKEWKAKYGEAAASLVGSPDVERTTDAEKLRGQLKEKDDETAQLQKDLESSLNEIEELKGAIDAAAEAKGYDDFQNIVEGLKREAEASKDEVDEAKKRIAELEVELASKRGGEAAALAIEDRPFPSTPKDDDAAKDAARASTGSPPNVDGQRKGLFGRLRAARHSPGIDEEAGDYRTTVRQRDLKIKSLEAMVHSNAMIVDKLRNDIEKMDTEREESQFESAQRIEKLEEENKVYVMQVAGFEKAFTTLNEQRGSGVTLRPSQEDESEIVDANMFMWDEDDEHKQDDEHDGEETADLRSKNLELQRTVAEMQANGSFQEDQIEILKAELVKLRVKSQQEKESALAKLTEENAIVTAQRTALESQLVEINRSARDSLSPPATPNSPDGGAGGSDPVLVAQLVMLEKKNKVLESSVDSLRSDAQEKLAPLMERIALLEEEKRMIQEEMDTKVQCRETTISSLESSLKQHKATKSKLGFKKKSPKR